MIKEYELVFNNDYKPELKLLTTYDSDNDEPVESIFDVIHGINSDTYFSELGIEKFYVAAFNDQGFLIGCYLVSKGQERDCRVYLKEIMTFLLLSGAKSFMAFHNHPNDVCVASAADYSTNNYISDIMKPLDIDFVGSYVISRKGIFNFLNHEDVLYSFDGEVIG